MRAGHAGIAAFGMLLLGACDGGDPIPAPVLPDGVSLRSDAASELITQVPHGTGLYVLNNTSAAIVVPRCEVAANGGYQKVIGTILHQLPDGSWSPYTDGVSQDPCSTPPSRVIGTSIQPGEEVQVTTMLVPQAEGGYRYTVAYFASDASDNLTELTSPTVTVRSQ